MGDSYTSVRTIAVDVRVDGERIDAQQLTVTLAVNAIPTVEVVCAPTSESKWTNVSSPTVSRMAELYQRLSGKSESMDCKSSVKVTVYEDGKRHDSIKLTDWILVGVGMTGIGATSAPSLTVVLQHPICKLMKVGSVYQSTKMLLNNRLNGVISSKKPSNLIEIMDAVYNAVAGDDNFCKSKYPLVDEYRKELAKEEYKPSHYLHEAKELFMAEDAPEGKKLKLSQAIARYVLPSEGGVSVWDTLIGASGTLMLSVIQDEQYNFTKDKLLVAPISPWKTATITLSDSWCESTEVPGADMFRIVGVMARKLEPVASTSTEGAGQEKDVSSTTDDRVLYVPKSVTPSASSGRIMCVSSPQVLLTAVMCSSMTTSGFKLNKGSGAADLSKDYLDGFDATTYKYCRAVYETSARSMVSTKAVMALAFRTPKTKRGGGRLILPGEACAYRTMGKDLYYGYIRQVSHVISVKGGSHTVVSMSHVRPTQGYMVGGKTAIAYGSRNPAYTAYEN